MLRTKPSNWFIPFCFIGALMGIILTTGHSPAAQLRYDTDTQVDYGQQFQRVLDTIRNTNVNVDAVQSEEELFNTAIDAILKKIGDKHGNYYSAKEFQRLNEDLRPQNYYGVGIQIAPSRGGALILGIFDNSPLLDMGIRVGDVITSAGALGVPLTVWDTETRDLQALVDAIKGPVGTDVILNIKRDVLNLQPITVPRIQTRQQYVFMKLSEDGILTMRMTQFSGTLNADTRRMLGQKGWLTRNGSIDTSIVKGVVLDLRGNPGGVLGQAVYISDLFLAKNVPAVRVIERPEIEGGSPRAYDYLTSNGRVFPTDIPRVVLIDGYSASASEIVAGAIQTHGEGLIMGIKSYGKGSVQTVTGLPGGAAIKTTTALYLAGGTMEIDGIGVEPDASVLQPDAIGMDEEAKRFNYYFISISMDPELDHQLNVAHTYINFFISGEHVLDIPESRQAAENKAHGAVTNVINVCHAKGLHGCPPVDITLFEGVDYGSFLSTTDAAGWMCYPDENSTTSDDLSFLDGYSISDLFMQSLVGRQCTNDEITFTLE
jgi:carboxyl-terminal processing protease